MSRSKKEIIEEIAAQLPEGWEDMDAQSQLHHVLLASDTVLKAPGDWILLDAGQTMRQLLVK